MSHPSSPQLRLLAVIAAVVAAAALALVAGAAVSCPETSSQTSSTSTMSSMSSSSTSCMPAKSAVSSVSGPAVGAASSIGMDAYLVKGDVNAGDIEKVHGTIGVKARDLSDISGAASTDALDYGIARIHVPSTNSIYEVRFTGLDKSSDRSLFGGVGLMKTMFGETAMGKSDIPRTVAYEAVFGLANIFKDSKQIGTNVPAHVVVLPGVFNTSTNKLAASDAEIDYNVRQIVLHIPGPVEGLPNNLMVGWPQAAISVSDVGGKVLDNAQVASALLPGETRPGGVVAGEAVEVMPHAVKVSLTDDGFRFPSRSGIDAGYYTFSITNNSSINRGFLIRGKDSIGAEFARYSQLLKPGETATLSVYLPRGSYQLVEFHQDYSGGQLRWFSNYRSDLSVRPL